MHCNNDNHHHHHHSCQARRTSEQTNTHTFFPCSLLKHSAFVWCTWILQFVCQKNLEFFIFHLKDTGHRNSWIRDLTNNITYRWPGWPGLVLTAEGKFMRLTEGESWALQMWLSDIHPQHSTSASNSNSCHSTSLNRIRNKCKWSVAAPARDTDVISEQQWDFWAILLGDEELFSR